jgi:ArsR family transcriptional regulator, arsenate/arsenite/antimonite-responsive transcriptional repressor / arsenate reductase (thioredoxin)
MIKEFENAAPAVLGVLAHDLRWTIVGMLAAGDLRASEIVARTRQPPSLVSYHLGRLREAGLVSVRRSTADGRDSYYALDLDAVGQAIGAATATIHPGLVRADPPAGPCGPARVLFICSGNSARSPMAEGWLNHLGGGRVTARSAGVTPGSLHPLAVAAMAEHGVDIAGHRATPLTDVAVDDFTRVITLCDRARENCADLPAVHWSIPNPAQAHPPDLDAFRATARELRTRIRYLLPTLATSPAPGRRGRAVSGQAEATLE